MTQTDNQGCINNAITHFGGKAELAKAMNTSSQNVYNWSQKGTIPASNALQIERVSGGKIKARDVLLENERQERK
jgi:DNA-binding transcriptional regulator YdaS (Cro superfamily)